MSEEKKKELIKEICESMSVSPDSVIIAAQRLVSMGMCETFDGAIESIHANTRKVK